MSWQHVRISRFGGPEVLELAEESTIPNPGLGEVRIKVLAAGTGFTDSFIRRGRLSLSETSSGWRLTENGAMLLFNEGSFQAHWLGGC